MKHGLAHYRQRYNPGERNRAWELLDDRRIVIGCSSEKYPGIKEIDYAPNHKRVMLASWGEGINCEP
jgi:hypothetical protein